MIGEKSIQNLNDIYMFVMQQNVLTILMGLYVLIYGIASGLTNWLKYGVYLVWKVFNSNVDYKQNSTGKILDSAWLVSVVWLCIVFLK